jgi:hypothetical protein
LNGSIVNWVACGRQIDALEWAWARGIHCWIVHVCCMQRSIACVAMTLRGWSYLGQSCHLLCWWTWVWLCHRMG